MFFSHGSGVARKFCTDIDSDQEINCNYFGVPPEFFSTTMRFTFVVSSELS